MASKKKPAKKKAAKKKAPKRAPKKATKKAAKKKPARKRGAGALRPDRKRAKPIGGAHGFTKTNALALIAATQKTGTFGAAADVCGLNESSVRRWIGNGRRYWDDMDTWEENTAAGVVAPEPVENKYAKWALLMHQARATFEAECFGKILGAEIEGKDGDMRPDWRANAWILERTNNKRYGRGALVSIENAGEVHVGEIDYGAAILEQIGLQSDRESAAKKKGARGGDK